MILKPLPRSLLKRQQAREALRDDRKAKAEVKAADGYRCRCCGSKDGVDCHEHKRRGAGGAITLANSYALCRVCHDLMTRRDKQACRALRLSLSDEEYSYESERLGEDLFTIQSNIDDRSSGDAYAIQDRK